MFLVSQRERLMIGGLHHLINDEVPTVLAMEVRQHLPRGVGDEDYHALWHGLEVFGDLAGDRLTADAGVEIPDAFGYAGKPLVKLFILLNRVNCPIDKLDRLHNEAEILGGIGGGEPICAARLACARYRVNEIESVQFKSSMIIIPKSVHQNRAVLRRISPKAENLGG